MCTVSLHICYAGGQQASLPVCVCVCVSMFLPAAGENWVAANKVGCDANQDPRLGSPIMQAPSFTGGEAGQVSELGAALKGSDNGDGNPAIGPHQVAQPADSNR